MEYLNNKVVYSREELGVLSFWAWNSDMNDDEVLRTIDELHECGYRGFFMHSRAGLLTPYLSDEWFNACRVAATRAKELDMEAWVYDEDGWPSGFAGGLVNGLGEKYHAKNLIVTETLDENTEKHLVASFCKNGESYTECEKGNADIYFYYEAEPNYVDLLSREVVAEFISCTYERYRQELGDLFGDSVPGFFTDEPQLNHNSFPYSFEMDEYFEKRNGFKLRPNLYKLLVENEDGDTFRRQYWSTVEEMMRMNFSKQIFDWCEDHGVKFAGHYPGEDSLIHQIVSTAGVMPKYEYMQLPGIDHLGRRITPILLTKQVTSAAKQFGRSQVLSETFGCSGWNVPFEQLCYTWGWQAMAGINKACLHIGPQSIQGVRKRDYPAHFSYHEPWWEQAHHLTSWMSGLNYKMNLGRWVEDVLVISPMESVYLHHRNEMTDGEQRIGSQYRTLLESLVDIQVGFDIGDEVLLARHGKAENGKLYLGACCYTKVIVAVTDVLKDSTWQLLKRFTDAGGQVVFTELAVKNTLDINIPADVVQNRRSFWYKYFESIGYKRPAVVLDNSGFYIATGLSLGIKQDGDNHCIYVWNRFTDASRKLILNVPEHVSVYAVDPESLERKQLETWQDEYSTYANIEMTGFQSLLLETEPGKAFEIPAVRTYTQPLDGTISLTAPNSLTLDYAAYSLDGGKSFSKDIQVVRMHPEMYEEIGSRSDFDIIIRYRFHNEISTPVELHASVESICCVDVKINGTSVMEQCDGWYVDRGISSYPLGSNVITGENELLVTYHMPKAEIADVDGLYETQVNRFFYPVEPEAVYITGNFDVKQYGKINRKATHISVDAERFSLVDSTCKASIKNLTESGLWFYRGNAVFSASIEKHSGEAVAIQIENMRCAFALIRCNGAEKPLYIAPHCVDITHMLNQGKNDIEIVFYGNNRNLLGPHHHIKGENNYVGPNTFKGKYGYEDIIVNFDIHPHDSTWTDAYSFVDFGCSGVNVIYTK